MVKRILTCAGLSLLIASRAAAGAQPAAAPTSDRGRTLYDSRCATCHGLDGHGGQAPAIGPGSNAATSTDDRLRQVIRDGLPGGMPAQGATLSAADIGALVQHLRQLQRVGSGSAGAAGVTGDPAQGRALFFGKAACSQCHLAEGRGGFLGSDLARTRLNADAVRQAIVKPDATPTARNALTIVTRRDGTRVTGLIRNEDNFSIQLQDESGAFHSIDKTSIAGTSRQAPLMPSDYAQRLSPAEIDHLVSYVMQLGAAAGRQPASAHD
jgi:putative heme-binding domain-containing protein